MKNTKKAKILETDYLIVGAGAVGMAFADVIQTETNDSIIMVDRYHKPGGHWNLAYPFVRLHQPSAFYGVSSTKLGKEGIDQSGSNKGLKYLSSGAEILAYYDDVMQHRLLASGRVKFFPLCTYTGDYQFESQLTRETYLVKVRKKLVNAAHMQTKVPATHKPNFTAAPDVRLIPINDLVKLTDAPQGFVIIGGGKTGVDAVLWLLEHGVEPSQITWVKSRDAWFTDRKNTQPDKDFLNYFLEYQACQFEAAEQADSIADLFARLEKAGVLLRIDKSVQPTMFRGATVSTHELDQLRRIDQVVRKGRITHIENNEIIFPQYKLPLAPHQVFVDCSADALSHAAITNVFSEDTITLQPVRGGQIVFSAAFIAHIEAAYDREDHKNELCKVVPLPSHATDWIKMQIGSMKNQQKWNADADLRSWLRENRLDGFSNLISQISPDDRELQDIRKRIKKSIGPAMIKFERFASQLD